MTNTHNQFLQFEQKISVPQSKLKKLIASRKALEQKIIAHFKTKSNLLVPKFWIQGSYKMGTMILAKDGTYDVDLGIYFLTKPTIEPSTLQKNVLQAVKDHTELGVEHRAKCVRVIYKGDFDIDLPVYYKTAFDKHPFLAMKGKWEKSDPKELCDWFEKKRDKNGQLVRLVKYLKSWANRRAKKMPNGISLTVWAANSYQPHQRDDVALFEMLKRIKSKVFCGVECINPATPGDDLCTRLDEHQRKNFKEALNLFMHQAELALNATNEIKACNIWRSNLGESFPAPPSK